MVKAEEGEGPNRAGMGWGIMIWPRWEPTLRTRAGRCRFGASSPRHSRMDWPSWNAPTHSLTSPGRESTGEIINNTVALENSIPGNCCSALFKNLVRALGSSGGEGGRGPQTQGLSSERMSGIQEKPSLSSPLLSFTPPCSF